jgi:antitoxin component YwqK of YwqJK toxin-antitoxin module
LAAEVYKRKPIASCIQTPMAPTKTAPRRLRTRHGMQLRSTGPAIVEVMKERKPQKQVTIPVPETPSINQHDDDGKKHGLWEEKHLNGRTWRIGTYCHGLQHGEWRDWSTNGYNCWMITFKHGVMHGVFREYHENNLVMECTYVNGFRHGLYKTWYSYNQPEYEIMYVHGEQHGLVRRWFRNGDLEMELMMQNSNGNVFFFIV